MPGAKHVSDFLMMNGQRSSSEDLARSQAINFANNAYIFKKAKALTDSSGERLTGNVLGTVFALPHAEGNRKDGSLEHSGSAVLDIRPDSPEMYIGPVPIQKRWGLRRVAHCVAGH